MAAVFLMITSSLAEMFTLAAVLPFLASINDPDFIYKLEPFHSFFHFIGLSSSSQILPFLTLFFIITIILSSFLRLFNVWFNGRMSALIGSDLGCKAFNNILYQPYCYHIENNSSNLVASLSIQINSVVSTFNAILQLLTSTFIAIGLFLALLIVDWPIATISGSILIFFYVILSNTNKNQLSINSSVFSNLTRNQVKIIQESLGAIRDVLLDGSQNRYYDLFQSSDRPMRLVQAQSNFLASYPRFLLETLAMSLIAIFAAFLTLQRGNASYVIPLLGTLALGAQRLLPSLQQIYFSWANIRHYKSAVFEIFDILNRPLSSNLTTSIISPRLFVKSIYFRDVSFAYATSSSNILSNLTFELFKGQHLGIIGSTGSGKSTCVDLLMGLLLPTSGQIFIDGYDISVPSTLAAWRASIAHVPQNIYLADLTIAENIAFSVNKDQIDFDLVQSVSRIAQIASYIESLPSAYSTFVGERGINLSGGQRQRIGIARALYRQTQVLILDEATSALDITTEKEVMQSIHNTCKSLTLISIAHRLDSLRNCSHILELSSGKIKSFGSYESIMRGR